MKMERENDFDSNNIEGQFTPCVMPVYKVKCKPEKAGEKFHPICFLFILGLVVAVIDHEHFRMKLMYKQKKQISADLKTAKNNFKDLQVNIKKAHLSPKKKSYYSMKGFLSPKSFYFVKFIMMEILFQEKS